jgi:hypothetical protein
MSLLPLCLATILYIWVAAGRLFAGDHPGTLIWLAYAAANIGFIWSYRP